MTPVLWVLLMRQKLYLNENGEEKGWGAKKVGGLIAKFKSKQELSADHFDGLSAHSDAVTGGGGSKGQDDTKDQIASYRATLTDAEEAALLVDFTLEPKKALERVIKDGKKDRFELPASAVTKKLMHALEAKTPKASYYVTTSTYLAAFLKRVLPTEFMDRILAKV